MKLCLVLALGAALLTVGCDMIQPQPARPAVQSEPAAPSLPDLRTQAGQTYPMFVAGVGAMFAPDALGLNAADRARLWRLMEAGQPAELLQGGGAEALVFRGCAALGCMTGEAVVAIDVATGGAFVGVRDGGGVEELAPNDRLSALLRLSSPTGAWTIHPPGPA